MLKYTSSIIALATVLFFSITSLYVVSYYEHFGIKIFEYSSFDEIFMQGFVPFCWHLFAIFICTLISGMTYLIFSLFNHILYNKIRPFTKRKILSYVFLFRLMTTIAAYIICLYVYATYTKSAMIPKSLEGTGTSIAICTMLIIFIVNILSIHRESHSINQINATIILSGVLLLSPFITINMAKKDYRDNLDDNTLVVETNKLNIKSDNISDQYLRYIGGVKDTAFYITLDQKTCYPIPRREINNMYLRVK